MSNDDKTMRTHRDSVDRVRPIGEHAIREISDEHAGSKLPKAKMTIVSNTTGASVGANTTSAVVVPPHVNTNIPEAETRAREAMILRKREHARRPIVQAGTPSENDE